MLYFPSFIASVPPGINPAHFVIHYRGDFSNKSAKFASTVVLTSPGIDTSNEVEHLMFIVDELSYGICEFSCLFGEIGETRGDPVEDLAFFFLLLGIVFRCFGVLFCGFGVVGFGGRGIVRRTSILLILSNLCGKTAFGNSSFVRIP